ncbi:putative Holliday junction resolvase, partial [Yersinia pestis PY-113]
MAGHIIG